MAFHFLTVSSSPLPALSLLLFFFFTCCPATLVASQCRTPPIIFNFGDSNSDTGGLVAGLGFPVNFPNGRTFFGRSAGRLSDGRLVIDFLCQSLNASMLSPYLDSLGGLTNTRFRNGANFAIVGSSTLPKFVPFSLNIQVMQFLHFKARTLELVSSGEGNLINEAGFRDALYMIDIGQNDIADSFFKKPNICSSCQKNSIRHCRNYECCKDIVQARSQEILDSQHRTIGLSPQKLSLVAQKKDLDSDGCISSYNEAARLFNEGLRHSSQKMRSELKDATIVYVDIYAIKYDLIANYSKYGFSNPLMACCGFGGPPYNYNIKVTCGHPGSRACVKGAKFINWDGIHYTEAANSIVASKVLSMAYSTPRVRFDFFCRS